MRENFETLKIAQYARELLLKFTPDEQPNREIFELYADFFTFLNAQPAGTALQAGLAKFRIDFLQNMGLAIAADPKLLAASHLGFSNTAGGFIDHDTVDFALVDAETMRQFLALQQTSFPAVPSLGYQNFDPLQKLLSDFLRYHLERDIKSEEMFGL